MTLILAFLQAHYVAIAAGSAIVLSSVITALTPYPQAAGVVRVLQGILDLLSFLTHRDSPGRFQMPLVQRSAAPGEKPSHSGGPGVVLTLLALVGLSIGQAGCAWFGKAADTVVACAKAEAKSKASQLLPLIADIVNNGADWKSDLTALAATLGADGMDIITCAVQELMGAPQGIGKAVGSLTDVGRKHAAEWLSL